MAAQREAMAAQLGPFSLAPSTERDQSSGLVVSLFALHGRTICGRRLCGVCSLDRPEAVPVDARHGPVWWYAACERQGSATISDPMPGNAAPNCRCGRAWPPRPRRRARRSGARHHADREQAGGPSRRSPRTGPGPAAARLAKRCASASPAPPASASPHRSMYWAPISPAEDTGRGAGGRSFVGAQRRLDPGR